MAFPDCTSVSWFCEALATSLPFISLSFIFLSLSDRQRDHSSQEKIEYSDVHRRTVQIDGQKGSSLQ